MLVLPTYLFERGGAEGRSHTVTPYIKRLENNLDDCGEKEGEEGEDQKKAGRKEKKTAGQI